MLSMAKARRLPRRTVRLRLTLLYGVLFLASGAALLAITYFFVDAATADAFIVNGKNGTTVAGFYIGTPMKQGATGTGSTTIQSHGAVTAPAPAQGSAGGGNPPTAGHASAAKGSANQPVALDRGLTTKQMEEQSRQFLALAHAYQSRELSQLVIESGVALGIMAVVALGLGWIVAGRVLRPVRTITATARDISASNLHERLALGGPDDELKELGDTIDGLLGRLEASFASQRQFVANASHELRTPLSRQRTLAQVALADPDATTESLRAAHERILASGVQQEQLIDALLVLSRAQASTPASHTVDLRQLVHEQVAARDAEAELRDVHVVADLAPTALSGDRRLVERLVANLLDNAIRYNVAGGTVNVETGIRAGEARLAVTNDGQIVDSDEMELLYEPFVRAGAERTATGEGFGLGLCIVRAVAASHGATLDTVARPEGGLAVEVRFPAAVDKGGRAHFLVAATEEHRHPLLI
jgi:signal transduction histidine kinase